METEKTKEATSKGKSEGESSPRAEASVSHTQDGARRSRRKSRSRNPSRGDDGGLFAPHDITDCIVNGTDGEAEDSVDLRLQLVDPSEEVFEVLKEQLVARLRDGHGETVYELGSGGGSKRGITSEQLALSDATLKNLAAACHANLVFLRQSTKEDGEVSHYLVRCQQDEDDFIEVRVAVVGNVDAGKSTMLGVLTHGELDNGRGFARQKLFRHKHEIESGRTSSVGHDILGFDCKGHVVNKGDGHGSIDWQKICKMSSKVITFIDLAGHEKYLKTTVFGMTGHAPDFCMLMVGSNAGVIGMAKEHLGLALALNVPVFVIVTKIDMCPPNVLQETMSLLCRILKSPGCRKIPMIVSTVDDVITSALNFTSERMCPIFQVSNVTGDNLELVRMFLNLLSSRMDTNEHKPSEFLIDDTYQVPGVGTVVSGTCLSGVIRLNDPMQLGPDSAGYFHTVSVRSIQRKRLPVSEVRGGQTASFALKKVKRTFVRKGMVMLSKSVHPTGCWEFEAEILVLHHPTTISPNYQAVVHCGSIRQTASILSMNMPHMRTGDKALCHFRFIKNPEYLRLESRLIFREGRTKAVGTITKIYPYVPTAGATAGGTGKGPSGRGGRGRGGARKNKSTTVAQATAKEEGQTN